MADALGAAERSPDRTSRTSAVAVAAFAEAEDLERVTLAVFKAAESRRAQAREALMALQCGETFVVELGHLDCPGQGPHLIDEQCTLPSGHAGDHAPVTAGMEEYRRAVSRHWVAEETARDALEAWEAAQEALDALSCRHKPQDSSGWPCIARRGHGGERS